MNLLDDRRVNVPQDLAAISRIDHAAETDPQDVGVEAADVARIWRSVEDFYRTGLQPAITLVVRRHGRVLIKRSIGHVHGAMPGEEIAPEVMTPDTPSCLFSASKAISSLLIHKLAEDGKLSLNDRVADYLPRFAKNGKGSVTILDLLSHRAGIPQLPVTHPDPVLLKHWDAVIDLLCSCPPMPGKFKHQAYHALTGGFIVGELVRQVGKIELPDALDQWLAKPLGLQHTRYGFEPAQRAQGAHNYRTGPKAFWPITAVSKQILGVDFETVVAASNTDEFLSAIVPAGNMYATADDACRVLQMMLNGGELDGVRVLKPQTIAAATRPGRLVMDRMLHIPMRFSPGFMLGENPVGLWGAHSKGAFGHIGFLTVLCWADPSRDISVALLNNGKTFAPAGLLHAARIVATITRACRPVPTRHKQQPRQVGR